MSKSYYLIDPQLYDDQFWWKKDDIEFWKSQLLYSNKSILELAAGTGRLALPLVREGANYTGIEISKQYTIFANNKLSPYADKPPIIQGDMRIFNINKKFDFIFIGFNSFLHLLKEEEAINCLNSIKKHMHKETKLYIDIFVPHPLFLYRPKNHQTHVLDFYDTHINKEGYILETIDYNSSNEIADVIWKYFIINKKQYHKFNFKMKMYFPDTMNRILIDSGYAINAVWGNYSCSDFCEGSNLQIYQCQKNTQ